MSENILRQLADAVLYEGHVLWPYRRSSLKNRQRWTFGGVYPAAYARSSSDRSTVRVECFVEGNAPTVDVEVRFLHVVHRQATDARGEPVDEVAGLLTWDETTERTVELSVCAGAPAQVVIDVPAGCDTERVDGGALVRSWEQLDGNISATLAPSSASTQRLTVEIANASAWGSTERDSAIRRTLMSAHAVLRVRDGALVSAADPPASLRDETATLAHEGLWPVLVGEEGDRHTMLAAPIILSDYARVAPESPGNFFDNGEIDQMLVLNILGMTDDEKAEMRAGDPRAREVLERTEALTPAEMSRLHGVVRELQVVRELREVGG